VLSDKVPTSPIPKGLPKKIQRDVDRKFDLWKMNPFHPSLNFKCVNTEYNIWSVRVTMDYRALAVRNDKSVIWYWIGDHADCSFGISSGNFKYNKNNPNNPVNPV
jgi:hypothetical protein